MTGFRLRGLVLTALLLAFLAHPGLAHERLRVTWRPSQPRPGTIAWVHVRGAPEGTTVEGSVGGRPLVFFPYAGGYAAVVGFDVDAKPGVYPWRVAVLSDPDIATASGRISLRRRDFPVERLTLPPSMVELDPETERRAEDEARHLRTLGRTVSPERLWHGRFVRPVAGETPGSGFGARRIINGQPRAPHSGLDFKASAGTPVVAANAGRVALVADYFFPGRLVAIDHGLGLYTFYFHLASVSVEMGERVDRGQTIGTVGATGRATGPHLHFAVQLAGARVDPAALLTLALRD